MRADGPKHRELGTKGGAISRLQVGHRCHGVYRFGRPHDRPGRAVGSQHVNLRQHLEQPIDQPSLGGHDPQVTRDLLASHPLSCPRRPAERRERIHHIGGAQRLHLRKRFVVERDAVRCGGRDASLLDRRREGGGRWNRVCEDGRSGARLLRPGHAVQPLVDVRPLQRRMLGPFQPQASDHRDGAAVAVTQKDVRGDDVGR